MRLATKGKFKTIDYYAFWTLGNNYVYTADQAKELAIVAKKYLAWGGHDAAVVGVQDIDLAVDRLGRF